MSAPAPGSWPSPLAPDDVVAGAVSFGEIRVDGPDVYWAEQRPSEGGRIQIVRRGPDGETTDLLPEGVSARTRVHEYGGGAWLVDDGVVWFSDWSDQRVYRLDPDGSPRPVTPEPPSPAGWRYADADHGRGWIVCVRESHEGDGSHAEPANELVAFPADGSGAPSVLVSGPDFVSSPRLSPTGDLVAWVEWDHPNMPWDHTRLRLAPVVREQTGIRLGPATTVAGAGAPEAVQAAQWRSDGTLLYVSDADDWWHLYALDPFDGTSIQLTSGAFEVGLPPWVFGVTRFGCLDDGRIVFAAVEQGVDSVRVREVDGAIRTLDTGLTEIRNLAVAADGAFVVASAPTVAESVYHLDPGPAFVPAPTPGSDPVPVTLSVRRGESTRSGSDLDRPHGLTVIRPAADPPVGPEWLSAPEPISFPTAGGATAHANLYRPHNPEVAHGGPVPLLVKIHGGPTGMARPRLDLATQFWTTRGFAVVDVNYRGSTGFGRPYRRALDGAWAVADVEDCIAAVDHLVDAGVADRAACFIRGGSAGGLTVLRALQTSDVFAGGADSYGVADLHALVLDTHKFEARYCDGLIAPYDGPDADRSVYDERSPLHHVDDLSAPLIVFQGLEDAVVPPSQSEAIVAALEAKGVPVEYHTYEGEQHGFRKAETTIDVLTKELAFYQRCMNRDADR